MSAVSTQTTSSSATRVASLRHKLSTTPGFLRALSLAIVGLAIVLGVFSNVTVNSKASTIDKVGHHTAPAIIDAQKIHTALLDADRNAANSYLFGGEGLDQAHVRYVDDVNSASAALEQAAQHTAYGDEVSRPLGAAIANLGEYRALVERARTYGRVGYPLGQSYLTEASKLMHDQVLPAIDKLDQVNAKHLSQDYAAGKSSLKPLAIIFSVSLVALAGLLYTQLLLSRRFKRTLNAHLAAGTALLVVFMGWASFAVIGAHSHLDSAESNYTQLHRIWQVRSLANDANLNESLSLIARGNGASFDESFKTSTGEIETLLAAAVSAAGSKAERQALTDVGTAYSKFMLVDGQIRQLDKDGQHNQSVALALGNDQGELGQAFAQLDSALSKVVDSNQSAFDSQVSTASGALSGLSLAGLLFALAIAVLTLFGLQARIREYRS